MAPRSKLSWSALTASAIRSEEITQEILIGEVEIISMLIPSSPRTRKTCAATPGWLRIPAPTMETLPIRSSVRISPELMPVASIASTALVRSSRATVKERSAPCSVETGSFWMITSTLTFASASAVKIRPAMPGSFWTPARVTRASSSECATAVIRGRSMVSFSETTRVPVPLSNDERQWIGMSLLRAYSTLRSCSTLAPEADISSISSKETTGSLRAFGTIRGSAVKTPWTSV